MKTSSKFSIALIAMLLLFNPSIFSQEEEAPERPALVTMTTLHWNMDNEDFDNDEWIATEKEFKDKVTSKNEYVMSSGFYTHRFTADNTELLYVQTYASWEDIEKAADRNDELSKEAWPDKEEAKAFFEKQSNYYANNHSDEIYATIDGAKLPSEKSEEPVLIYMQKSQLAFPKDGSNKEYNSFRMEYNEHVIQKNEVIMAYYPLMHSYGADNTEFIEVFVLKSMADFDAMNKRTDELFMAHWNDETKRKEDGKKMGKYFTGVHGDYIYTSVPELNY